MSAKTEAASSVTPKSVVFFAKKKEDQPLESTKKVMPLAMDALSQQQNTSAPSSKIYEKSTQTQTLLEKEVFIFKTSTSYGSFFDATGKNQGAIRYPDGKTYIGSIRNSSEAHGWGTLILEDGTQCRGLFEKDLLPKGTLVYPDSSIYRGSIKNNSKAHGWGTLVLEDGTQCQGLFEEGLLPKGTIIYPDFIVYEGAIQNNKACGMGTLILEDGTRCESVFDNGKAGECTISYPDGTVYEGTVDESFQPHGKGTFFFEDSTRCEGVFDNGKAGECTIQYPDEMVYKGTIKENFEPHGKGAFIFKNGVSHEGEIENGVLKGKGVFRNEAGVSISGRWVQNGFIADDSFLRINNPVFLSSLLNETLFPRGLNALGIFCNYYEERNLYPELTRFFKETLRINNLPQEKLVEEILTGLNKEQTSDSYLLPLSSKEHQMLLEIVSKKSVVIFKIYNSGEGVDHHAKKPVKEGLEPPIYDHYQTMLQIQVPKKHVTKRLIKNILNVLSSTEKAYSLFLELPEVCILKQEAPIIWQKEQKGSNCTLRSLLVFLKHKLGSANYNEMKINLLSDCEKAIKEGSDEFTRSFLPVLVAKRLKRQEKFRDKIASSPQNEDSTIKNSKI